MKIRFALLLISFLVLAAQQGNAQEKGKKVLQEMAGKKAEREKQLGLLRSKANEQKGQQQFEKRPDSHKELPPAAGNGQGHGSNPGEQRKGTDATPVDNRSTPKE